MSREVRCAAIAGLGELHYGRKKIQPAGPMLREFHEAAASVLKHPLLTFADAEIAVIGGAFAETIRKRRYTCYACAIMPDHVHLLIRKHRDKAEIMIGHFQDASRQAIVDFGQHPPDHPVWGGPGWKVYLDSREDIERIVRYIERNPIKARRAPQHWPFVQVYDGWLPGQVTIVKRAKPQAEGST